MIERETEPEAAEDQLRIAGIHQIRMPMPLPLDTVQAYALETDDGWVLIDSGFPYEEAQQILTSELERVCGSLDNIRAVIISHWHPDHSGFAGWFQQMSGADVYVHELDWERVKRIGDGKQPRPDDVGELYGQIVEQTGFSWDVARRDVDLLRYPVERPTAVRGGEQLTFGSTTLELVWTPGHTDGHLCVFDRDRNILFSGDHLLARITPHVGIWSRDGENPLLQFERSLGIIERLNPSLALPAHEAVIDHPAERAGVIREHHQGRRQLVLDAMGFEAKVAKDISDIVFKGRTGAAQEFFALAETLAHLEALVIEGGVERVGPDEDLRYRVC